MGGLLALAHHVDRLVADGQLRGYSEAARLLGITRSRMAQIVGLLGLSAEIQSGILTGTLRVSERRVRSLASTTLWTEQGEALTC